MSPIRRDSGWTLGARGVRIIAFLSTVKIPALGSGWTWGRQVFRMIPFGSASPVGPPCQPVSSSPPRSSAGPRTSDRTKENENCPTDQPGWSSSARFPAGFVNPHRMTGPSQPCRPCHATWCPVRRQEGCTLADVQSTVESASVPPPSSGVLRSPCSYLAGWVDFRRIHPTEHALSISSGRSAPRKVESGECFVRQCHKHRRVGIHRPRTASLPLSDNRSS